jgi:hypothetical protein
VHGTSPLFDISTVVAPHTHTEKGAKLFGKEKKGLIRQNRARHNTPQHKAQNNRKEYYLGKDYVERSIIDGQNAKTKREDDD